MQKTGLRIKLKMSTLGGRKKKETLGVGGEPG